MTEIGPSVSAPVLDVAGVSEEVFEPRQFPDVAHLWPPQQRRVRATTDNLVQIIECQLGLVVVRRPQLASTE